MRPDATPGQAPDHEGFDVVVGDARPAPRARLADKGYDADRIRAWAQARDTTPVIPTRGNREARAEVDETLNALHRSVERCLGRRKKGRRVATR